MTKEPVACEIDATLEEACRLMESKNIGSLVVLQNGRVAGLLTDRDIVLCVAREGIDCSVEQAMTRDVACVRIENDLFHLVDVFRSAGVVRRVPVVDDRDQLVGIVSISDVAVVAEDLLQALFLEESKNAQAPHLLTGAKELAKRMRRPGHADEMPQREAHAVTPASTDVPKSGRGSA